MHCMVRALSLCMHCTPGHEITLFSSLCPQAMQQFSAKSVGARVIILGYAFMVLILINA